jgi:hypothetical protein
MKKLRLKALSLGAREILSREQLKAITGGCSSSQDCGALLPYCVDRGLVVRSPAAETRLNSLATMKN